MFYQQHTDVTNTDGDNTNIRWVHVTCAIHRAVQHVLIMRLGEYPLDRGVGVMVHNGDAVLERAITLNVKCHFYTFRKESTIRIVGASIVFNWQSP